MGNNYKMEIKALGVIIREFFTCVQCALIKSNLKPQLMFSLLPNHSTPSRGGLEVQFLGEPLLAMDGC